ncbi:MAG TPA: hypothetical protein VGM42_05880 [Rhodopila sp.]
MLERIPLSATGFGRMQLDIFFIPKDQAVVDSSDDHRYRGARCSDCAGGGLQLHTGS